MIDQTRYRNISGVIIDNLEGGYYHPDMMAKDPVKFKAYGKSGETMYGIDRRYTYQSAEAQNFWAIIDNANARYNWPWNYMGGNLAPELRDAAADVMYPQYDTYANKYLGAQSKAIVESDDRLLFNFIYATWNGPTWFGRLASDFNDAVNSGVTNTDDLVNVVVQSRLNSGNSLIVQGGKKIAKFINDLAHSVTDYVKKHKTASIVIISGTVVALSALWYFLIIKKRKAV